MRRSIIVFLILIMVLSLLTGCHFVVQQQDNASKLTYSEPEEAETNEITPYQFLNLICANAEELSFTYSIIGTDAPTATFQREGDVSVESFIAHDMNDNPVSVRELEKDGKVHYIMDESKIIKTYLGPAEDFLLYQMLAAASTSSDLAVEAEDYYLYEYSLPFVQDENLNYKYRFYMRDGMLKKLTIALGEEEGVTYEFSRFQQELIDSTAFKYPEGYAEEEFYHTYTGEHMPPWWEIGNDQ